MEIGNVLGTGSTTELVPAGENPMGKLGKEEFLSLLIKQLEMQDPFEPLDNSDMIAQLAQFSTLELQQEMTDGFDQSVEMDLLLGQLLNNTMATTMIGKGVRIGGSQFTLGEGPVEEIGYNLAKDADLVSISILNSAGSVVRTESGLATEGGNHQWEWDGKNDRGQEMPQGQYTFSISAFDGAGDEVPSTAMITGTVSGIRYRDGSALVLIGETELRMSDVQEVFEPKS